MAYFIDGDADSSAGPSWNSAMPAAIWRFRNEGNRAAFAADPEVYMPRFGGYDPVAVARGARRAGPPAIVADRTNSGSICSTARKTRDGVRRDPEQAIDAAERRWPDVLRTLGRRDQLQISARRRSPQAMKAGTRKLARCP